MCDISGQTFKRMFEQIERVAGTLYTKDVEHIAPKVHLFSYQECRDQKGVTRYGPFLTERVLDPVTNQRF